MKKPNILLITTDQQRYDTICAMGYNHMITPNLDALVHEGCCFPNAYSPNPACLPARHNIVTGLTAKYHGFDDNYFKLENSMKTSTGVDETVSNIDEVIFPMYVPDNTYLSKQDKVFLDNGERVILTFAGDKPFTMVQETVKGDKNVTVVPTGELEIITDSVGYVSDQSVSWISNGIEYYVSSSALTQKELIDVAKSMSVMPVGK